MSIIKIDNTKNIQTQIDTAPTGSTLLFPSLTIPISRLKLKSGIIYKGNNTVLYGSASSGGSRGQDSHDGWIILSGVSNIEFTGFTFKSSAKWEDGGHGNSRNCLLIDSCKNIKIHDLIFQKYIFNDAIRVRLGDGVQIWNCTGQAAHDFISLLKAKNVKVSNCKIDVCINTGIRLYNATNCTVEYCTIYDDTNSGWCGIEVENALKNCLIDHCIIRNIHGSKGNAGIQYVNGSGSLTISNCVAWDLPGGFIRGGVPVQKVNKVEGSVKKSEEYWVLQGYGYGGKK